MIARRRPIAGWNVKPPRTPAASTVRGLTLLETTITMAIALILAGTAVPQLRKLGERQRAISAANLLVAHLAFARNHAINHRRTTTLCPSSDGRNCLANNNWSAGWLVVDAPAGAVPATARANILMAAQLPTNSNVDIYSSKGRVRLRYLPDGRSAGANTTFRTCISGVSLNKIIVSNSGRARTEATPGATRCP